MPLQQPAPRRSEGKEIVTLLVKLPADRLKAAWEKITPKQRADFFGNAHAKELDLLVKNLGKYDTSGIEDHEFGQHLASLHAGNGMHDEDAAAVLHDPAGVRLAHRAVMLVPGTEAHRSTMGILKGRYKENINASRSQRTHRSAPLSAIDGGGQSSDRDQRNGQSDGAGDGDEDGGGEQSGVVRDVSAGEAAPPVGSEPDEGATEHGSGSEGDDTRRITGSADIPLTPEGEEQAADMASQMTHPFDVVFCAPNKRSIETAKQFSDDPTEIPALDGWARGELEGKPMDQEEDTVRNLIENPDTVPPGVSPESGEPGVSYNAMLKPLLSEVQSVMRADSGYRILFVTSGGNLQAIHFWLKAGAPEDLNFPLDEIAKTPYWSTVGKIFKAEVGKGLIPVEDNTEPSNYFCEHSKTSWNSKPGKS